MDGKVLAEKVSKKSSSVTRKGTSGKSKTRDVAVKDDVKEWAPKGEKSRKVGGGKSGGQKSMAEKSNSRGEVEVEKVEDAAKENIAKEEENKENVKTPMKRKRGADGEIVRAFVSFPEKVSSRLRLRKEVPTFRKVELSESDGDRIVGKRVKVYWSGSRKWFVGSIKSFDYEKGLHKIYYDDGDKEDLDLRQERFELKIMPSDGFVLGSELHSEKKVKGLDGGEVSAETLKEVPVKVGDAKPVKNSKPEKKKASKKAVKGGSSKSQRRKATENKKAEEPAKEMDVDVVPEKVDKAITDDEVCDTGELGDTSSGKEHDESQSISEIAIEISEAQAAKLVSSYEKNGEESGDTGRDHPIKVDAEPVKMHVYLKKKVTPRAAKMRSSKSLSRTESKGEVNRAANMEVDEHHDEVKVNIMHGEIDVKESLDVNYHQENDKIESLEKEASGKNGGMSYEAQATKPKFSTEKKGTGLEDGKVSEEMGDDVKKHTKPEKEKASKDAINRGCSNPQGVKDDTEDLAANVEVSVRPEKAEEKVISGEINVKGPGGVNTVEYNDETVSLLKAVSEETQEVSVDLQPTKPKSLVEEENPESLQGTLKIENSESAGDIPKEELEMESISNGGTKTSTQGLQPLADNQSGSGETQVDWASQKVGLIRGSDGKIVELPQTRKGDSEDNAVSQKNPVRRGRSKVQTK